MNKSAPESQPLFAIPAEPRTRTSDVLLLLAGRATGSEPSLRSLTDRLGDRTFGMLLVLVAILSVVPVVSTIAGLLVVSLGIQMSAGMTRAWLPRALLDRPLPADRVRAALLAFEPKIRWFERFIRPRWRFTEAPIVDRFIGLIIALLGMIIMIPLPLTNVGPAVVVIFMGLGLMERDGVVQLCSVVLSLVAIAIVYHFVFAGGG